jgi:hypothetical protein
MGTVLIGITVCPNKKRLMHDICLFVIGSKSQLQIHCHESHKDRKKIRETLTWSNTGIDSFFGSEKNDFPAPN